MKIKTLIACTIGFLISSCACEIEIASSDVPQSVLTAFSGKYAGASDVEWEVEKEDGKLYYEAEFKVDGKRKEAYFRPDGTFSKEE
ncbi:MAG: hypothetical protein HWD62_14705 [Cyclobacteriaceae bacterium]|nr:MAG: hypothetical protein HWD62_14705 [Cyclobacteriaceae bacterium]